MSHCPVLPHSDPKQASISGAPLENMKEYISDPSRIVYACWEHKDITRMGDGVSRMAFTGQSFLSISIDMSVDIKLWPAEDGTVKCKSVGYSVDDMAKILGQVTTLFFATLMMCFVSRVFFVVFYRWRVC